MNPLHHAQCVFTVVDTQTVVFRIDLNDNPHLRDPAMVRRCMVEFMTKYPRVDNWDATYNQDVLAIIVKGNMNFSRARRAGY